MSRPALHAQDLTKRFGETLAVDRATFDVPFGAVTAFAGANGSGKTTTIRMLLGLTIPTSGEALIDGRPYRELGDPRRMIGTVLNRVGAHPGLTGRRHLRILAASSSVPPERIDVELENVGLTDAADRRVGTYSTGMQQRLALASALMSEPRILVLDEPTSGLDPMGIRWLTTLLREQADRGVAVFLSTHHLADLTSVVDNVVVIDRGAIVANQQASTLIDDEAPGAELADAVLSLVDGTRQ